MEANKENQHKENQGKDAQKPTQNPALREEMEYDEHGKEVVKLKWPLTRRERIRELDLMLKEYEGTPQVENILAARAWHSKFALDEYVPKRTVLFEKGKKVEPTELSPGLTWYEGDPGIDMMMTGHGQDSRL